MLSNERIFGIRTRWFVAGTAYLACCYLIAYGLFGRDADAKRSLFMGCIGLFTTTYIFLLRKGANQDFVITNTQLRSSTAPFGDTAARLECRICGNSVPENADSCPTCGARPRFDFIKLFATAILTLALIGSAVALASIWITREQFVKFGQLPFILVLFAVIFLAIWIVNKVFRTINHRKW